MVDCRYVHKNGRKLIMDLDFFQFAELIDIKPAKGSHLIHSMSKPLSEEDIEDKLLHNWLDHFKIKFHQIHASGHMSKEQLVEMVKEINSNSVFAVHTENQLLFKKYCSNVRPIMKAKRVFPELNPTQQRRTTVDCFILAEFAIAVLTSSPHLLR